MAQYRNCCYSTIHSWGAAQHMITAAAACPYTKQPLSANNLSAMFSSLLNSPENGRQPQAKSNCVSARKRTPKPLTVQKWQGLHNSRCQIGTTDADRHSTNLSVWPQPTHATHSHSAQNPTVTQRNHTSCAYTAVQNHHNAQLEGQPGQASKHVHGRSCNQHKGVQGPAIGASSSTQSQASHASTCHPAWHARLS